MDKELYKLISKAREACAGSNIQDIDIVLELLIECREYIWRHYKKGSLEFSFLCVTEKARIKLRNAKDYNDRLVPDQMLCDILNEMLKGK